MPEIVRQPNRFTIFYFLDKFVYICIAICIQTHGWICCLVLGVSLPITFYDSGSLYYQLVVSKALKLLWLTTSHLF